MIEFCKMQVNGVDVHWAIRFLVGALVVSVTIVPWIVGLFVGLKWTVE